MELAAALGGGVFIRRLTSALSGPGAPRTTRRRRDNLPRACGALAQRSHGPLERIVRPQRCQNFSPHNDAMAYKPNPHQAKFQRAAVTRALAGRQRRQSHTEITVAASDIRTHGTY